MQNALYQYLELAAEKSGQLSLLRSCDPYLPAAICLLALVLCFVGFRTYRPAAAGLALVSLILAGYTWLEPSWGLVKCVTFCAVVGVCLGVVMFLQPRLSGSLLSGAVLAGFVWQAAPGISPLVLILVGLPVAVAVWIFPVWGICGFTALWGGVTLVAVGSALMGIDINPVLAGILGIVPAAAGCVLQLKLFGKKQTVFKQIMPKKLAYYLEKKRGVTP